MNFTCEKVKVSFKCEFEFDIKQGGSSYQAIWTGRTISPLSILALKVKVRVDQIKEYELYLCKGESF